MNKSTKALSPDERAAISQMYSAGRSLRQIEIETGRSRPAIRHALRACGVETRSSQKLTPTDVTEIVKRYRAGESSPVIAKDYGVTKVRVSQILSARGLTRSMREAKPPLPCKEDFFDVIDTEVKAYWLGFLAADGCIHTSINARQIRTRLSMVLGGKDREHVVTFLRDIESAAKIGDRGKGCVGFAITCDRMTSALIMHGITSRKSLRLKFPRTVPEALVHHFIRGYFDGDGCVSINGKVHTNRVVNFVGTKHMLSEIQRRLRGATFVGCLRQKGKNYAPEVWQLIYGGRNSCVAIADYLYRDATRWLPRKREKFDFVSRMRN